MKTYRGKIKNIIRYIQAGTPETLVQNYFRTKKLLEERGYELIQVLNTWNTFTKDEPYRGVDTIYAAPDGTVFELQFHTAESIVTKEAEHPLKRNYRNPETSEKEKEALNEERYQMNAALTEPEHIEEIPSGETPQDDHTQD